jgi:hypothetical protein
MAYDQPVKALVLALTDDAAAAVAVINRLKPEVLCFVLPEAGKALVEASVQPKIEQMPRRWDWLITGEPAQFVASYRAIAHALPDLLRAWEVQPGELVVDRSPPLLPPPHSPPWPCHGVPDS